jgi:hypothetical protein
MNQIIEAGGSIVIIFASTKKEAAQIANKEYGENAKYIQPYKYSKGRGNNFYEFNVPAAALPASPEPAQPEIRGEQWEKLEGMAVVRFNEFARMEIVVESEKCPSLKRFNDFTEREGEEICRLIAATPSMLKIVKRVAFWFGNKSNYPEGTAGHGIAKEAKAILSSIKQD